MSKEFKTAKGIFNHILLSIQLYNESEKQAIAFRLLEYFHISRTAVLADKKIEFRERPQLQIFLNRINQAEPVQYVLGETEFYGRKFYVNKHVLIPRPETEELVDLIIRENRDRNELTILDVGTGSGCIPITLAKEFPEAKVIGLDVSEEALAVARSNALHLSAKVEFIRYDILQLFSGPDFKTLQTTKAHIIVSNPPYVIIREKKEMHPNVLEYEPSLALFVSDEDPLIFYTAILDFSQNHLIPGGWCYFEINENYGEKLTRLMEKKNFGGVQIIQDLHGKNRFAKGKLLN